MFDIYQSINEHIKQSKEVRQAHLDLNTECIELGGDRRSGRGVLAHFLKTTIPKGMKIHLCHACHNGNCTNYKHMYWGTPKENSDDAMKNGHISFIEMGKLPKKKRKPDSVEAHQNMSIAQKKRRKRVGARTEMAASAKR